MKWNGMEWNGTRVANGMEWNASSEWNGMERE